MEDHCWCRMCSWGLATSTGLTSVCPGAGHTFKLGGDKTGCCRSDIYPTGP